MMDFNFSLNQDYHNFKGFLADIKNNFIKSQDIIHQGRNEIRILHYKNRELAVKSFMVPRAIARVIYTDFRPSKARRSYDHALLLKAKGINTPDPVGFIEFYSSSLLKESYYVSIKYDYDFTIREPLLDSGFPERDMIFLQFGEFTCGLHKQGIIHRDYSPGNILIKKEGKRYSFALVDLNRMVFKDRLRYFEKLRSFARLCAKDNDLEKIVKSYSSQTGIDIDKALEKALRFSRLFKKKQRIKFGLRGIRLEE